jgi:heterodisulfide reductase subunit A-like polyferredoxin
MQSRLLNVIALGTALCVVACSSETPIADADVIVIGAGIAGISAALEASAGGARVGTQRSRRHTGYCIR